MTLYVCLRTLSVLLLLFVTLLRVPPPARAPAVAAPSASPVAWPRPPLRDRVDAQGAQTSIVYTPHLLHSSELVIVMSKAGRVGSTLS